MVKAVFPLQHQIWCELLYAQTGTRTQKRGVRNKTRLDEAVTMHLVLEMGLPANNF